MPGFLRSISGLLPCTLASLLLATTARADASFFEEASILEAGLHGPLSTIDDNRESRDKLPFELVIGDETYDVDVRVRGKSRLRVCSFMPLKIFLDPDQPVEGIAAVDDELKLATHCYDSETGDTYVLRELLAYRIFALLTDASYRTRLLRMTYADPDDDGYDTTRFGFLVESTAGVADRLGGTAVDLPGVSLASLDQEHVALVYVFQYLIGNTDWSLVTADGDTDCCHNGKLVDVDGRLVYLPYDFDLSGLVHTRYARPDPSLGIRRVTVRRYRGYCMDRGPLEAALDRIAGQRAAVLGLVDGLPWGREKDAEKARDYLDAFFERAEDHDRLLSEFERRCLD